MTDRAGRRIAIVVCVALLFTNVDASAFGQDPVRTGRNPAMNAEEDARLAVRAVENRELENFTAGQAEVLVYGVIVGVMLGITTFVGLLAAGPLGFQNAKSGRGFVPRDFWDPSPGPSSEKFVHRSAVVFGFPIYCLGYLLGLPFQESSPSKEIPQIDRKVPGE